MLDRTLVINFFPCTIAQGDVSILAVVWQEEELCALCVEAPETLEDKTLEEMDVSAAMPMVVLSCRIFLRAKRLDSSRNF